MALYLDLIEYAVIDKDIEISDLQGGIHTMVIGGIIYYGQNHFTSRIVDTDGSVFYNDEIMSKKACIYEAQFINFRSDNLWTHGFRWASAVIDYSYQERNCLAVCSSGPLS
jgi:hypothetical protein